MSPEEYDAQQMVNVKFRKELLKANCGAPTYGVQEMKGLRNCRYAIFLKPAKC